MHLFQIAKWSGPSLPSGFCSNISSLATLSKKNTVCVCVCVCVRARVRVCVFLCSDLLVPVIYYCVTNHPTQTFLMAPWLGLCASTAGGMGLIPGGGSKILCAMWYGQKIKENKSPHDLVA